MIVFFSVKLCAKQDIRGRYVRLTALILTGKLLTSSGVILPGYLFVILLRGSSPAIASAAALGVWSVCFLLSSVFRRKEIETLRRRVARAEKPLPNSAFKSTVSLALCRIRIGIKRCAVFLLLQTPAAASAAGMFLFASRKMLYPAHRIIFPAGIALLSVWGALCACVLTADGFVRLIAAALGLRDGYAGNSAGLTAFRFGLQMLPWRMLGILPGALFYALPYVSCCRLRFAERILDISSAPRDAVKIYVPGGATSTT